MRKALVLLMTACFLLAGCIEGLAETVEGTIDEMTPGCNDPAALNYAEDDTSDSTCMSQEMMGAAIDDFSTLMDADEPPADMGIKITMTGVDEDMGMGAYTVVATTAENENTVYSGSDITISSMGMTISQAWTITSSDDGGTLIQAAYMDQSFLMSSAMSMEDVVAAAGAEETEEESSGEMDMEMPGAADMVTMLGAWDGCVECPMPTAHAYDPLDGGLTVTYMVDAQDIEMGFSMNADGTWVMTSYSYDTGNESMGVEILSGEEVAALLMIDTTLGYEALPFTLEEADAEDDVFICDDGEEIPADWENDGFADCSDGSDENVHDWTDYDGGYCEWISEDTWWKCKYSEEDEDWDSMWYYCENHDVDWHCTDDKGQSADYEHSANGTEWSEPEIFVCDNGDEIPMSYVNDGWDDCGDNSDEGVEEQEEGSHDRTFTVTSDAEFAFAGSFDDYSVELANCTEDDDGALTCGNNDSDGHSDGVFDILDIIVDGLNNTGVGFIDEDASGTLTNGDTIVVGGNTSVNWTHVRLHSTSADAYSDENPLQELPGFTALLGVLSLMGAAMIGRRD